MEAAQQSGAKKVMLIEEPLAAAIGAGLPVEEPVGSMIINIGAGTTEIAVISLGGIVYASSIKTAGDVIDQAIYNYLKKQYKLEIGLVTAEKIKIKYGDAFMDSNETQSIRGIYLKTGLPAALKIPVSEINNVIKETLDDLLSAIRKVFENTPPQLVSDIIDNGVMLTGGGANLRNIDKFISSKVKFPTHIPPNPEDCVAIGTGKVASNTPGLTKISLMGYHNL
jgi:rod shape-determining protein MreB